MASLRFAIHNAQGALPDWSHTSSYVYAISMYPEDPARLLYSYYYTTQAGQLGLKDICVILLNSSSASMNAPCKLAAQGSRAEQLEDATLLTGSACVSRPSKSMIHTIGLPTWQNNSMLQLLQPSMPAMPPAHAKAAQPHLLAATRAILRQ